MIGVFADQGKIADLVIAALEPLAAEGRFDTGILKLLNITAKLHLQMGPASKFESIELGDDTLQGRQSRLPLRFRVFFRRSVVIALDHLTGGGNANVAKNSVRLAEIDLVWRKIDAGIQIFYLGARRFWIDAGGQRQGQFRIADIDSVEERLVLQKRGIIDVERNPADSADDVFTVFIIKNTNILRDQTPKRIECDPADRSFHAMFAQLLHHQSAPFLAESFFGKVPAAPGQGTERKHRQETHRGDEDSTPQRRCALLRNALELGKIGYRHADSFVRGNDVFNTAT